KEVLDEMTAFASERVQFSRPIVEFEITQRKLARIAADTYAADAMLGVLTDLASRNRDASSDGTSTASPTEEDDWSLEAACCKVFASDLIWRAADELVQVAGGR